MTQPKMPQPTISFIDQYCRAYQKIFPEVRSYEAFKQIVLGILTPSDRKSLSTIAKIVGEKNSQLNGWEAARKQNEKAFSISEVNSSLAIDG